MKYKMLVKNVLRQDQSYTGAEIKEMTLKRMEKFQSDTVTEFYNKYFTDSEYKANLHHLYYIRKDSNGHIYLSRVK